jgi:hypothetical protein
LRLVWIEGGVLTVLFFNKIEFALYLFIEVNSIEMACGKAGHQPPVKMQYNLY